MTKVLKTLRNNWKKSVFACVVSYFGIDYLLERQRQFHMMRALCEEANKHGSKPLPQGACNKHITLFLNPAASNRKSKTKFEKFAEPLLHMAGFLVTVVRTEKIDHAKELTGMIQKTNVIVVAGGDGTLSEVVTGLLRREDADEATMKYPIGVIPVGHDNEFAESLGLVHSSDKEPYKIAEAAMTVVKHQIKPKDVLEIKVIENKEENMNDIEPEFKEEEKKPLKPVYSMCGLRLGAFREALKKKADMPTILGDYFTTFWAFFRTQPDLFKAEIRYTPHCKGCLKCVPKDQSFSQSKSILSRLASFIRPAEAQGAPLELNEECGTWTSLCVETPEFNIRPLGDGQVVMEIGKQYTLTSFVAEGFNMIKKVKREASTRIAFTEAEILPIHAPEFCSIDGDEFEVKPIHIKILKSKLYFFSPA